jgi:hypothetical protein
VTQRDLAELLKIPVNTFRMWDGGLRRPPAQIVAQAPPVLWQRVLELESQPADR